MSEILDFLVFVTVHAAALLVVFRLAVIVRVVLFVVSVGAPVTAAQLIEAVGSQPVTKLSVTLNV